MEDKNISTSKLIIEPRTNAEADKADDKPHAGKEFTAGEDTDKQTEATSPTLSDVIKHTIEGEAPQSSKFTLRRILGGEILNTATIRRQIWLFLLIVFFMVLYISNRYSCQQDLIEIDNLTTKLQDAKYKALSSSSELTEKSRESNVLNVLKSNEDSVIQISEQPPYIIQVPSNE